MTLFKRKIGRRRHVGRRVVGVGVGVAMLVLGLEGTALAAPTITALSPTNGPNNCVVVVTGTGFTEFPADQTDVDFMPGNIDVDFAVIDDTIIWAEASGLTPGVSYTVRVSNTGTPTGVTSTATFLATTGVGACAPTITSFTPTCGLAGTTVVITGTNLIDGSSLAGAQVRFSPYAGAQIATHTLPDVDDVTTLSVIVPSGSGDGPISVGTDVGPDVFSTTSFLVPPPDCTPDTGNEHARSITLKMKRNGRASGIVSSTEDPAFTDCVASVPVKLKYKKKGKSWKNAGRTSTTLEGNYALKTKGKPGKYKAIAVKVNLGDPVADVCLKARSPIRTIKK